MNYKFNLEFVFSAVLLFLVIISFISNFVALLTAFIFTFIVPGLICLNTGWFKLKNGVAVFIPLFSVMFSTHLIYYLSLLLGYSKETILISFLILAFVYLASLTSKNKFDTKPISIKLNKDYLVFIFIFFISLAILYKSVWFESKAGVIITGSNWQDTPLHYAIIESINNGNFPPQMPYYAGIKMQYHYFVDFHTAILEKTYGFMPKLLPLLNSIFILIFAISIYSLAKNIEEKGAIISTIIATFGWGFSYFTLLSALFTDFNPMVNYIYQYNGFFGLPPIFDNLLQQRPLLVGLPAFTFVLTLLRDFEDKNRLILAGVVTGLLFRFHVLSFFCCFVAFLINVILRIRALKPHYFYFLVSIIIALPFIFSASHSATINLPWAFYFLKGNPVVYYTANLGIPFMVAMIAIAFKRVEEKLLKYVFVVLFLLPNLISFTPNPWDMYKFFHFSWIPISVISGIMLSRIKKEVAMILVLLSVLASASVVIYNVSTNYIAANWDEYNAGMWIRNNTEERSVFLTYYSIHSPPTMIGGRLRVLSYLNWPYGHGIKLDEIWERVKDVDMAYNGSASDLKNVIEKYGVKYIYVGREEIRNYPKCIERFDKIKWLRLVYDRGIKIYKVNFEN